MNSQASSLPYSFSTVWFSITLLLCFACKQSAQMECMDRKPPGTVYSCAQQRSWGKCSASWMQSAQYCAATCGFCEQSSSLELAFRVKPRRTTQKQVLKSLLPKKKNCMTVERLLRKLPSFSYYAKMLRLAAEAEKRTADANDGQLILSPLLSGRGDEMLTLLIPSNDGFETIAAAESLDDTSLLTFVGEHILPAGYTSRSLSLTTELLPNYGMEGVQVKTWRDGSLFLLSNEQEAKVLFADVLACNAFIHFLDRPLHSLFSPF